MKKRLLRKLLKRLGLPSSNQVITVQELNVAKVRYIFGESFPYRYYLIIYAENWFLRMDSNNQKEAVVATARLYGYRELQAELEYVTLSIGSVDDLLCRIKLSDYGKEKPLEQRPSGIDGSASSRPSATRLANQ